MSNIETNDLYNEWKHNKEEDEFDALMKRFKNGEIDNLEFLELFLNKKEVTNGRTTKNGTIIPR